MSWQWFTWDWNYSSIFQTSCLTVNFTDNHAKRVGNLVFYAQLLREIPVESKVNTTAAVAHGTGTAVFSGLPA